jgi:allantoate deiminase
MPSAAQRLSRRLRDLGRISDEPGRLTRTFLSPAMARANRQVARWMREAGLRTRVDAVGNLIGTTASPAQPRPVLLLGSHLDTVRDAGRFDGAIGVLLPLVALEELRRRGITLPYDVEVIGFSEEEGVRFPRAYLGSEGYVGALPAAALALRDQRGISVAEALRRFNRETFRCPRFAHPRGRVLGYLEVHLEQGPVLEAAQLPLGVVSAIAGQSRLEVTWTGRAGHAGTTPMRLRRDALAAAAEFTLAVERLARATPGLVATVGILRASPGAANVIPGVATHSLDVRHARDPRRRDALRRLQRIARGIALRRGVGLRWRTTQDHAAVPCCPRLTGRLAASVRKVQDSSPRLVSGAGHDAVVLSSRVPVTMLFVRCRDGLSHHPREHVADADLGAALAAVQDFLLGLARESP